MNKHDKSAAASQINPREKAIKNQPEIKQKNISAFEPQIIGIGVILAVLSAIICMQMIGRVGVTPNTSLIGAIFAMLLARVPLASMMKFRSLERQNLLQTIVSGAGFSAANCGFIAVGILYGIGKAEYIMPMAVGCIVGTGISVVVVGRLFDSKVFPASGAWPPGVATASAIQAGDEGGKKGKRLLEGLALGVLGSYFKIPMAGIGIVFIANLFSMAGLGIGLILRGYSVTLFGGFDMGATNIPQGVMVGAGGVALIQSLMIIFKDKKKEKGEESGGTDHGAAYPVTVSAKAARTTIFTSLGAYALGAVITAAVTGILTSMAPGKLLLWILWAAFSSTVAMMLVGMAAMHSGWFPAFAITTIFMTLGIFLGFPSLPLAVLTGYIGSSGPCFADMGYDLKTGWILRGEGSERERELYGRRQQVIIEFIGVVIGILVVLVFGRMFMEQNIIPPISKVFATAVSAGADMSILKELALWAIPGAVIQVIFGNKMVGVLFATGLLLNNPIYGVAVLSAVVVRIIFGTEFMDVRGAGLVAGDGLFGFFSSIFRAFF